MALLLSFQVGAMKPLSCTIHAGAFQDAPARGAASIRVAILRCSVARDARRTGSTPRIPGSTGTSSGSRLATAPDGPTTEYRAICVAIRAPSPGTPDVREVRLASCLARASLACDLPPYQTEPCLRGACLACALTDAAYERTMPAGDRLGAPRHLFAFT